MIVHQTVSPLGGEEPQNPPTQPVEMPLGSESRLFPLHRLDAFLHFIFQLLLVFIISASVFPALRWLDTHMQQLTSNQQRN